MEAPGPYPGRRSNVHGASARSVEQVDPEMAPDTIAWISWSIEGSVGRGPRVRAVADMVLDSVACRQGPALGELDVGVAAVKTCRRWLPVRKRSVGTRVPEFSTWRRKFAGVESSPEDRLVDLAEIGERERVGEEPVRDLAVADLVAQAPEGVVDDLVVVEGEAGGARSRRTRRRSPGHPSPGRPEPDPCRGIHLIGAQQCPVHDRHDAGGGAIDGTEGVELLEVAGGDAGRLGERAGCRGLEAFGDVEPSAGECPEPFVRISRAAGRAGGRRSGVLPRPCVGA